MDVKEAYKVLQAACGIEVGDQVKVLRGAKDGEMGWDHSDLGNTSTSNGIFFVIRVLSGTEGFMLNETKGRDRGNYYPFFCLELVEKAKPKLPPIMVGGNKVGFYGDHIKVCGVTVLGETLREMVKRLEENN